MEPNKYMEKQELLEEDICKLSYKELRKLATQRNINPKFKKAQLVKALLNTSEPTVCDTTEYKEPHTMGRVTRSKASILKPFDNSLNHPTSINTNIEKTSFVIIHEGSPTITEKQHKNKNRGKRAKIENQEDISCNTSEISISEKPLSEITNSDEVIKTKFNYCESLCEKTDSPMRSKQSKRLTRILYGKKVNSRVEVKSDIPFNNICSSEIEKQDLNVLNIISNNDENTTKRRGRKKKNVVVPGVGVDWYEDHNNAGKMFEEETTPEQGSNNPVKPELENKVELKESIPNCSANIDRCEPKKIRRGKQGKRDKNSASDISKNKKVIPTQESPKLNAETTFTSLQGNISEEESSKSSQSKCSLIDSCVTSTSLESADLVDLNLTGEGSKVSALQTEPSQTCSEAEIMPVPVPIRSSTFVLDNKDPGPKEAQFSLPNRSNTFTLSDEDGKSQRQHFRFTAATGGQNKSTPGQNVSKIKKSIGARILSSSIKRGDIKSSGKQIGQGSTVKKTITKNTATPGSVYKSKFGVARKAPNFKSIHQKLFNNMESLGDNHKRKLERAQALIGSPAPRCATSVPTVESPKWALKKKNNNDSIVKTAIPQKVLTPVRNSPSVAKSNTPADDQTSMAIPKSSSINRFGFNKNRIKKEKANTIVGMKMAPVNIKKKKDEDREFIQGVRMNKRFLLQMKMRQNNL